MAVDTPQVQRGIAIWTILASSLIGGLAYILGARALAKGLAFGVVVSIVNYRIVGIIIHIAFKMASPDLAKVLSFAGYHVRFWILVVILYLVIPRTPFYFGVGTFIGLLIPKIIMGVFVVMNTNEEWWSKRASDEVLEQKPAESVNKPKGQEEGLRYPGLDHEDSFRDLDEKFNDPSGWF